MQKLPRALLASLPLLFSSSEAPAQTIDNSGRVIPYAGSLDLDGSPVDGAVDLRFRLFATEAPSTACLVQELTDVEVAAGRFAVSLTGVPDACLLTGALWMELEVRAPGAADFEALSPPGGGRTRVGSVPFAAAVPQRSSFLVGTGEVAFKDDSNAAYTLRTTAGSSGISLRALSTLDPGEPLFRVLSVGGAERLRVEHAGDVTTDNGLVVAGRAALNGDVEVGGDLNASGDVAVQGRLNLEEQVTSADGSSGCQRVGSVMTCWGGSVPDGDNKRVTWSKAFDNASYTVTCTAIFGENEARTVTIREKYANHVRLSAWYVSGAKSGVPADCIAIGLNAGAW